MFESVVVVKMQKTRVKWKSMCKDQMIILPEIVIQIFMLASLVQSRRVNGACVNNHA